MKLYKTTNGIVLENNESFYRLQQKWDILINRNNLYDYLLQLHKKSIAEKGSEESILDKIQAPIEAQEVWAAGVTYLRSRDARMEESKSAGSADFYDMVYNAQRPELFFKALPHRVAAHNQQVFIRKDSAWNVPEPELTLFINSKGNIQGYTIGNDVSSRDIEGENPLYLPQAKVYERSAALGPCLYVPARPISADTFISIIIKRDGKEMFKDSIQLNRMKRQLTDLAAWLFKECEFPYGCFLMTGTGIVPPSGFTLEPEDNVAITIDEIGTLSNTVAISHSLAENIEK